MADKVKPPVDLPFGDGRLPVLVSATFLEQVKEFLEGVQDRKWEPAEISERANVLEFKLDALLRPPMQPHQRAKWEEECKVQVTPAYGTAERCPSTLAPENPNVRCILPVGHEGAHQDHILPIRRWS